METFCICLEFDLYCPGSFSLKDKRSVIRGLRDQLDAGYNVSTAEVDYQDHQRRSKISVAAVNSSKKQLHKLRDKIIDLFDSTSQVQVRDITSRTY